MKKSKLEHSFDQVKLSEDEKTEILKSLQRKKQPSRRALPLRPAIALGLVALLVSGTYLTGRFLNNPRQSGTTFPATSPQTDSTTSILALTTRYPVLEKLSTQLNYPVSMEKWDEIAGILNKAIPDPQITGMDMDLRESDVRFVGEKGNSIMIRDYREVYILEGNNFKAYHLDASGSEALRSLLTEILRRDPMPLPTFSDRFTKMLLLPTQKVYSISTEEWGWIVKVLDKAIADPQINAVTDDLRPDDLELIGEFGNRIFIREYKEIYMTGSNGTFAAFHLEAEDSAVLKVLLTDLHSNLIQPPTFSGRFTSLVMSFTKKEYSVSTQESSDILKILNRAVHDPQITGVRSDLRAEDIQILSEGGSMILIREYREVYLEDIYGTSFDAFHLETADSNTLRTIIEGLSEIKLEP